ncbi:endonuclease [Polaribacter sp. MSW13]|uniref:Endonuclease n=1 Tax=Polaribacter marinus TaxID=2916838 RepID=A0A9X1VL04_9FLAO|nr:endonuclease [Polaribacter marinus]MCI2228096.1 endonuclease [Polaribacter marinus]
MLKKIINLSALLFVVLSYGQVQPYYNDVNLNLTGIQLKEELATKVISTHTRFLTYDEIWDASKITDVNPNNNQEVVLIYGFEDGSDSDITNNRERDINIYGGGAGNWNREHVFAKSLGDPNLGTTGPGSDAHHLRPADSQRNSSRNNEKFATGSGNASLRINGGWYPGDEWKGDVARMMMYMYIRYGDRCLPTNVGIGDNSSTPDEMIDLFLQWNVEDPVSDFEKTRNTYHEDATNNSFAQGNRNPFIDNPILATRIWGGTAAADLWGIYSSSDSEAPTVPTNLSASNITTFSVDLSWGASTDNIEVTSYDIYLDGVLVKNTTSTTASITGLNSNTNYSFTVLAKDIVNNASNQSIAINQTTLTDVDAPTIPTNIVITNQTGESFKVTWDISTDNTAVTEYDVYIDGNLNASTTETTFTVTGLAVSTTYAVQVLAKDAVNNQSILSTSVNATTTDGSTTTANELFFSEYVEGSGSNKALEIVNVTSANIDLSEYSIKRQSAGGKDGEDWDNTLILSGTIIPGDVYVIINGASELQKLIDEADLITQNISPNWGAPINFNGDDNVGLFKNDVLIDIIGTYNSGGGNFAKDKTLRRKSGVSQPNTAFDISNEWDVYPKDTVDDIGQHNTTLNVGNFLLDGFNIYPNPVEGVLNLKNTNNSTIQNLSLYNYLGKKIFSIKNPSNVINVDFLSKGIYMLKFEAENKIYNLKIIKQ